MSKLREIEGEIAAGKVIVAIKELRSVSRWGLKETKQAVDVYRASGAWPESVLQLPGISDGEGESDGAGEAGGGTGSAFGVARIPPSIRSEIEEYCARGKKIQAIKRMRDGTGLGLRDAKDAVDHFMKHGNWQHVALSRSSYQPDPAEAAQASAASEPAVEPGGSATPEASPSGSASNPGSSDSGGSESPGDPGLAAAVAALESDLGHSVEVRLGFAAEHSFRSGHLVLIEDRACFVFDDYGRWRVDPVLLFSEVSDVEERSGLLGTELTVQVGYVQHRFARLADGDATAAVALFRVYAA